MFGSQVETAYLCTRNRERCGTETVCDWLGETSVGEFLPYKGFCTRYLTLAGLREREGIRPFGACNQPPEKKVQKNFWKHLVVKNKSLTFASAFQTKAHKEEFFETIIDKQTSSTSLHVILYIMCRKTETVNYRLLIDLVLEQIINLSVEKRYFYNEEFDPGSGWTLATGLTHASRGAAWS